MKSNQKCNFGVYKYCMECGRSFVDTIWCGDLLCNRCLEMCWIVDNVQIAERILGCCDYHRPSIVLSNIITRSETHTTQQQQQQTEGKISYSKPNANEFTTPLGNFKSYSSNFSQKSESISNPSKNKATLPQMTKQSHEKYTESKSLPTIDNAIQLNSQSQLLQQKNSTASTSFSDSFFKADFLSKFLPKSFK